MTTVKVKRVITVEYECPIENYGDTTRDEIVDWEKNDADPSLYLDDIATEHVTVTFAEEK